MLTSCPKHTSLKCGCFGQILCVQSSAMEKNCLTCEQAPIINQRIKYDLWKRHKIIVILFLIILKFKVISPLHNHPNTHPVLGHDQNKGLNYTV